MQQGSNSRGNYLSMVVYSGGGSRIFIIILGDKDGMGWRKLAEALREVGSEGGNGRVLPSSSAVAFTSSRSYREALQSTRDVRKSDMASLLRVGDLPVLGEDQRQYGSGRWPRQVEVNLLKELRDMQALLEEMNFKVKGLYVAFWEKKKRGWAWGVGWGHGIRS